jgi:hypothetical protein
MLLRMRSSSDVGCAEAPGCGDASSRTGVLASLYNFANSTALSQEHDTRRDRNALVSLYENKAGRWLAQSRSRSDMSC